mgnify:CR=1 FL=1
MENFITCKYISLVMLFEKVKMSVEMEMFTLIIFHKIKENIRSDNKEWIQAHTKLIRLCMRLFLISILKYGHLPFMDKSFSSFPFLNLISSN